MTTKLITGKSGSLHVNSEDDGALNAYTIGSGCYVLNGCECAMTNSNTLHISPGELLLEGRYVRVMGVGEDVTIQNGTQSQNRNDLVCIHYVRDSANGNIESTGFVALRGTPTSGAAADPTYAHKSILAGDSDVYIPFCRVPLTGITVGTPVVLLDKLMSMKDSWDSVSQPPSGGWDIIKKYPDGTAECVGTFVTKQTNYAELSGGWYQSTSFDGSAAPWSSDFPTGLFIDTPAVTAALKCNRYGFAQANPATSKSKVALGVISYGVVSGDVTLHVKAEGRWK